MVVAGSDYPTELLFSAALLAAEAQAARTQDPPDDRNIPKLRERSLARAAIFTACNCIESLLMDMVQGHVAKAAAKLPIHAEIEEKINKRQANISWTIKDWPKALVGVDLKSDPGFAEFDALFLLRNELAHPKMETYGNPGQRTLDQLLRAVNAAEAQWAVENVSKMAAVLFQAFGQAVPVSIRNPWQ